MAKVIINNIECEGQVGERLVDVARRYAAHVGFLCDGLGAFFVETSACRVLSGGEHLSPPTDLEKSWLQQSWLEAGHRMACQATIQGSGTIEILSRAEELRRQTVGILTPPEGSSSGENLGLLINNMTRIMLNQVACFPANVLGSFSHMTSGGLNIGGAVQDTVQMVSDSGRVVQSLVSGTPATPRSNDPNA